MIWVYFGVRHDENMHWIRRSGGREFMLMTRVDFVFSPFDFFNVCPCTAQTFSLNFFFILLLGVFLIFQFLFHICFSLYLSLIIFSNFIFIFPYFNFLLTPQSVFLVRYGFPRLHPLTFNHSFLFLWTLIHVLLLFLVSQKRFLMMHVSNPKSF